MVLKAQHMATSFLQPTSFFTLSCFPVEFASVSHLGEATAVADDQIVKIVY